MLRLPMSRLQISGLISMTCCTLSAGPRSTESALGFEGSLSSWKKRAPGPVVRLISTSEFFSRMRSTVSR
jgi:hypothetical protein